MEVVEVARQLHKDTMQKEVVLVPILVQVEARYRAPYVIGQTRMVHPNHVLVIITVLLEEVFLDHPVLQQVVMEHLLHVPILVPMVVLYPVQLVQNILPMMDRIIVPIRVLLEEPFQGQLVANLQPMMEPITVHIHVLVEEPFQGLLVP